VADVARWAGRTQKSIRAAISRGTFPAGRIIAGRRCWTHEDLMPLLVDKEAGPSPKAQLVKVKTRPAPHDKKNRVQVDMHFDCPDPRKEGKQLRIQKTAPEGYTLDSAKVWAREHADRFLAEIFGEAKTKKEEELEPEVQPQPQTNSPTSGAVTLAEIFAEFEDKVLRHEEPTSRETWASVWRCHLDPNFGAMPIGLITKARILDWRDQLRKKYADTTCNHLVSKLRSVLSHAVDRDKLTAVPRIKKLKVPKAAEKEPYTDEEMSTFLQAVEGDQVGTLALLLSFDVGLRRNEMLGLRWCDVDFRNDEIHVRHSMHRTGLKCVKGKKAVSMPMTARLKAELWKARHGRKLTDHVFRGIRNAWLSESKFRNYMIELALSAGVEWKGFHKGKHTFVTVLLEEEAPLNELQLLARHENASTTETYMHVRDARKARRSGIARLEARQSKGPAPEPVKPALRIVKS
jgi:integrase